MDFKGKPLRLPKEDSSAVERDGLADLDLAKTIEIVDHIGKQMAAATSAFDELYHVRFKNEHSFGGYQGSGGLYWTGRLSTTQ